MELDGKHGYVDFRDVFYVCNGMDNKEIRQRLQNCISLGIGFPFVLSSSSSFTILLVELLSGRRGGGAKGVDEESLPR